MDGIGSEVLGGFRGFVLGQFCSGARFSPFASDSSSQGGEFVNNCACTRNSVGTSVRQLVGVHDVPLVVLQYKLNIVFPLVLVLVRGAM